jgi:hypothetical protein
VSQTTGSSNQGAAQTEASLSDRQRMILRLIVREYVATGRAVSSKSLVENSGIGVSSATIRNEMAALEEFGYLGHLHTSGGRVRPIVDIATLWRTSWGILNSLQRAVDDPSSIPTGRTTAGAMD